MPSDDAGAASGIAKSMAERSLSAGYLKDALQYLQQAHTEDPEDGWVMLKLGWTYNILHEDDLAYHWFGLARNNSDEGISTEARKAYKSLRPSFARFRTTAWLYPFFSTRWHDMFGYGQIKTDMKLGKLPFRPYVSVRLFGDTRGTIRAPLPQVLSENSVVLAVGAATSSWRGLTGWFEAGTSIRYRYADSGSGRVSLPITAAAAASARASDACWAPETPGLFFELNADAIYVSRYQNDLLLYTQTRLGVYAAPHRPARFHRNASVLE